MFGLILRFIVVALACAADPKRAPECERRLGGTVFWQGNVAFPNFNARVKVPPAALGQRILALDEDRAGQIFATVLRLIDLIDPRESLTTIDLTHRIWVWTGRGGGNSYEIWFARDPHQRITRAYVRRNTYEQDLIITTPSRLLGLEAVLTTKLTHTVCIYQENVAIFDRLPVLTAGFLL